MLYRLNMDVCQVYDKYFTNHLKWLYIQRSVAMLDSYDEILKGDGL